MRYYPIGNRSLTMLFTGERAMSDDLDHTADVKVLSSGRTLAELFVQAALDLNLYIFGPCQADSTQMDLAEGQGGERSGHEIAIQAGDYEALLVDWLSEILFHIHVKYMRCVKVEIREFGEFSISASLKWQPATALHDIKAVTYSELEIKQLQSEWQAIITYDI